MFLATAAVAASAASDRFKGRSNKAPAFDAELVKHINSLKTTWRAEPVAYRRFANLTVSDVKRMMGSRRGQEGTLGRVFRAKSDFVAPASFDARKNWPNCPTVAQIRDQSACGSCWAFGAVEAISDRYCVALGSTNPRWTNLPVSALDMLACCDSCGNGCEGGYPQAAWQYWVDSGLPTEACKPYPFAPCEHHIPMKNYPVCPSTIYSTPSCPTGCTDGSTPQRFYGASAYDVNGDVASYQQELMTNGPFELTMDVYSDFEQYRGGVYSHQSGDLLGGHAIRLLGWGTDSGTDYWVIANSWNADWGEGGTFRIVRGTNECNIESGGSAGTPKAM